MDDELPWPALDPIPPGWLDDTPDVAVQALRGHTAQRRAATAHLLWRSARSAVLAGERQRDPGASDAELAARVLARMSRSAR